MWLRALLQRIVLIGLVIVVSGSFLVVHAGLRGPGKYSGVVVFDRWDTCLLLSGSYVTYVSNAVKEELRPYRNQAIQVDASVVSQPMNPGDALIQKFAIMGPAPQILGAQSTAGLSIRVRSDFDSSQSIAFLVQVRNSTAAPIGINSSEFGPTLLGLTKSLFTASDGKSEAWIARTELLRPAGFTSTINDVTISAAYEADSRACFPEHFTLASGESKEMRVLFKLPPGSYELLVGFGGGVHDGRSIASNAVSFHVEAGGVAVLDDKDANL